MDFPFLDRDAVQDLDSKLKEERKQAGELVIEIALLHKYMNIEITISHLLI